MDGHKQTAFLKSLACMAVLAICYFGFAHLGLRWATVGGSVTPIYPAAGIAMAGLLLGGLRLWPAIVIGRMLAFWFDDQTEPLWMQLVVSLGTTGSAVAAAYGMQRWGKFNHALTNLSDVLWLVLWGAILTPVIGATVGMVAIALAFHRSFDQASMGWLNWWIGNVTGILIVTPLLLVWARDSRPVQTRYYWPHFTTCLATTGVLSWLAFQPNHSVFFPSWLIFPVLIWAALAFGVRGAATTVPIVAVAAVWGAMQGGGLVDNTMPAPFNLLFLQEFVAIAAVMTLVLAVVADERRGKEKLRKSNEYLQRAQQAARLGTWDWDLTTHEISWSDGIYHLLGEKPGSFKPTLDCWAKFIIEEDRGRLDAEIQSLLQTPGEFTLEFRIRRSDGAIRWIASIGRVEAGADGAPACMRGVNIDIHTRKVAEDGLRESERRFRQLADALPHMVWVTRPDGYHEYYNHRWYEFTGVPEGSTDGEGWNGLFHPEDQPLAWERWRHSLETGEPYEIEYRLRHRSGEYRWTLGRALPIRNESGAIERWFGTCTDIQEFKQLQSERERLLESERDARVTAERESRLKDEFLATLSHELRTPLNAILGWTELIARNQVDEDDAREGLRIIERNARTQAQLIEDLLDMSRIISGKIRLDVQPVNLMDVIEASFATVQPAAAARSVKLRKVLDPNAGPISGDPNRLQQVVWNLLSNAVKFTPRGGTVEILLQRVNSSLEIVVTDSGEGIESDFLPHVFDRFRQADGTTTRRHGGLGLGLSIVKNLVDLHGGTVRAWSAGKGRGSTFTVSLPLAPVQEKTEPQEERRHPAAGPVRESDINDAPRLDGVRVLVVDDDADARDLLRRVLDSAGAQANLAASADEALELLRSDLPQVLISDIGMPDTDGYELIRQVRALSEKEGRQTPAIALTAFARSEDRRRAIAAGYQMHLAKPVDSDELLTMVASLAGRITVANT
jgi:PAS domain S-box-containing protein